VERTPGDLVEPGLASAAVPWLRVDADGRIQRSNAALRALAPARPERLEALLADPPLRPDGVHVLAGGGQAVRAVILPAEGGQRDVLLIPLDVAEVSGLVPDHFLEELPVALARLESSAGSPSPTRPLACSSDRARSPAQHRRSHRGNGPSQFPSAFRTPIGAARSAAPKSRAA
jgi:hypothetical protein